MQTQIEIQRVAELEHLLRSRGAAVSHVFYAKQEEVNALCSSEVKKDYSKLPYEKSRYLDREVGVQPSVVLAVRVDGRVICYPLPIEYPRGVHLLVFLVDARGDTPEAREKYAWDLVHAAAALLEYPLYTAELRAKLPRAWALFNPSPASNSGVYEAVAHTAEDLPKAEVYAKAEGPAPPRGAVEKTDAAPKSFVDKIVDELLRAEGVDPAGVPPAVRKLVAEMLRDPLAAFIKRLGVEASVLAECIGRR
jgi:hypothetical protein